MDSFDLQVVAHHIRRSTFEAISNAGGGHFGGSLSEIELLTALYFKELRIDPQNPEWPDRDRFILSKGHGGPGLYATLAERGVIPKELLSELDQDGSRLPKHIDRLKLQGIDVSSGPLGQGISIGVGMALAARIDAKSMRVYVLLGDGECNEGQVWEAASTAYKYRLDNLTAIIDRNRMQVDGPSSEIMPMEPLANRWTAFGWNAITINGHCIPEILEGFDKARSTRNIPTVIIAETIKGKGVSFMENRFEWHSGAISLEQTNTGIADLEGKVQDW